MKTWAKAAGKAAVFLFVLLFGCLHLSYLFRNTGWSRYNITEFYEEQENSLDVVLVGGSNVFRFFSPLQAFHQEGFASYNYAIEFGTPILTDVLRDIERTQKPALIVVDPRFFSPSIGRTPWRSALRTSWALRISTC